MADEGSAERRAKSPHPTGDWTGTDSAATVRAIFRAAPVGIGLVADRLLLRVNERICQMLGYQHEEFVGQRARILYNSDEDFIYVGQEK